MQVINTRLISHPMNWVIVLLMLIIAGAAGSLILAYFDIHPMSANTYANVSPGQEPGQPFTGGIQPQGSLDPNS